MATEHYLIMAFDEFNQHVATQAILATEFDMREAAHHLMMDSEGADKVFVWPILGEEFINRNEPPVWVDQLPWAE